MSAALPVAVPEILFSSRSSVKISTAAQCLLFAVSSTGSVHKRTPSALHPDNSLLLSWSYQLHWDFYSACILYHLFAPLSSLFFTKNNEKRNNLCVDRGFIMNSLKVWRNPIDLKVKILYNINIDNNYPYLHEIRLFCVVWKRKTVKFWTQNLRKKHWNPFLRCFPSRASFLW